MLGPTRTGLTSFSSIVMGPLAAILALTMALPSRPPTCTIKVAPTVSLAPLRYIRITTSIEPDVDADGLRIWAVADVVMDAENTFRTSRLFEGDSAAVAPKTIQTEWKSIVVGPGEYEVWLQVHGRQGQHCEARARIKVGGGDDPQ